MTYKMLYAHISDLLTKAGIDSPAFDTLCMFECVCDMNRHKLIMDGEKEVMPSHYEKLMSMAEKRAKAYPLQYILGVWEFMGLEFYVGEGVLIPREDTSVVVELGLKMLKNVKNPHKKVLDLCAGSGAISIAISKNVENIDVTALELSTNAMKYLKKNIEHNHCDNVNAVYGDVFESYRDFCESEFDMIISNPPYIIRDEIKTLQQEVQYEPFMALDGGVDGYDFYKKIIKDWSKCLKKGGAMVFELGENQFDVVEKLMLENGFENINCVYDIQNVKRGIAGIKATVQ